MPKTRASIFDNSALMFYPPGHASPSPSARTPKGRPQTADNRPQPVAFLFTMSKTRCQGSGIRDQKRSRTRPFQLAIHAEPNTSASSQPSPLCS